MKLTSLLWVVLCLSSAGMMLYWNASKLVGADPLPRMKDLEFVPSAQAMRVMSMGHTNTSAKLRWIDAFSYLQLQFEKRDDTLIGNSEEGGFDRLYDALIDLDPKFEPFYEFAIMSESLLDDRSGTLALRSAQRGCLELPHSMNLWRNLAAHIKARDGYNPHVLDGILTRWALMAPDERERYHIERWKSRLGVLDLKGLEQLDYWAQQIVANKPKTPLADMAVETLYQQLNRYCKNILQEVYDVQPTGSIDSCLRRQSWYHVYGKDDLLQLKNAMIVWGPLQLPAAISQRLEQRVQALETFSTISLQSVQLRTDPYGYPYRVVDDRIVSTGEQRFLFKRRIASYNMTLERMAVERGRWPADLDEVHAWLNWKPLTAPSGGQVSWQHNNLRVEFSNEAEPWPLREMAAYWLELLAR